MNLTKRLCVISGLLVIAMTCSCDNHTRSNFSTGNAEPEKLESGLVIDLNKVTGAIDGLCYGVNDPLIPEAPFRRIGGNRLTGYNWEINASSAGNDYKHISDRWLNTHVGLEETDSRPAAWILKNVELHKAENADSMVTLPLAGYVVADGNGTAVGSRQAAPSPRWVKVETTKPGGNFGAPDLKDGKSFIDEEVAWLVSKFGSASAGGVKYYCLDNEPSLWSETHARIHPKKTTYKEVADKSIATAKAVLSVDPDAKIVGAALYGWFGHAALQNAPDKNAFNKTHGNFSAYYLSRMAKASEQHGRRLLHIFDFHWYPEATAGGKRISLGDGKDLVNPEVVEARIQAPRSLWDPTYVEESWITDQIGNQPIQLIPRMQKIIAENYPETRFGIFEYSYGGGHHISGGLATADVLGIFGRYHVASGQWTMRQDNLFEKAAFRLYLNYDGQGSRFEENALEVPSIAAQYESIYAACSQDKKTVTVILINKQTDKNLEKQFRFKDIVDEPVVRGFRFGPSQHQLEQVSDGLSSVKGGFSVNCPPHTATLVELKFE